MEQIESITLKRVVHESQVALALGGRVIPGKSGWVADVTFADGERVIVDRLDGEDAWLVNGLWSPGCAMPVFWNGELSRCTIPHVVRSEIADAVNDELNFVEWGIEQDEAEGR